MNCADYDLCERCERSGVHEQHVFLKLKQPLQIVHECQWTTDDGQRITSSPGVDLAEPQHGTQPEEPLPEEPLPEEPLPEEPLPELIDPVRVVPLRVEPEPAAPKPVVPRSLSAVFVKDLTIDDFTLLPAGAEFTKIWRIANNGPSAWPEDTELRYLRGEMMAPAMHAIRVPPLQPGEHADIAVEMVAPALAGQYTAYWRLYSTVLGLESSHAFWVSIEIDAQPPAAAAAATSAAPACSESAQAAFADALKQLASMGFIDTAVNTQALNQAGGQVGLALDWLLAQAEL
jgi:hypothetical protein